MFYYVPQIYPFIALKPMCFAIYELIENRWVKTATFSSIIMSNIYPDVLLIAGQYYLFY